MWFMLVIRPVGKTQHRPEEDTASYCILLISRFSFLSLCYFRYAGASAMPKSGKLASNNVLLVTRVVFTRATDDEFEAVKHFLWKPWRTRLVPKSAVDHFRGNF